jgi:hypothetical protein
MGWFMSKWPALVGILGWLIVTKLIWNEIPVQDFGTYTDEDASGMAIVLLTSTWWGYFFGVAVTIWFLAGWLKLRSVWLLLLAPAIALWGVNKTVQLASSDLTIADLATSFLAFTVAAGLPILVGGNAQISKFVSNNRNTRSVVK